MFLQEFEFEIIYIKGSENVVADALSRLPLGLPEVEDLEDSDTEFRIMVMHDSKYKQYFLDMCANMHDLQMKDDRWRKVINQLNNDPHCHLSSHYKVHDNVLFFRRHQQSDSWCVCIPAVSENHLIWHTHFAWGHYGAGKCTKKLKIFCHFPNMSRKVHHLLKTCLTCQKSKPNTQSSKMKLHSFLPKKPLQLICVDISGPYPTGRGGVKYIFGVYDVFSKFVKLYALKAATAKAVIRRLQNDYFSAIGKPTAILSDNGSIFICKAWEEFLRANNVQHIRISRFNPAANPMERIFREFNRFVRTYSSAKHSLWVDYLNHFEQIVNNLPIYATEVTPSDLIFQIQENNEWLNPIPRIPRNNLTLDEKVRMVLTALMEAARRSKQYHDKNLKRIQSYKVGETVLLRTHPKSSAITKLNRKWQNMFIGPFVIIAKPHDCSYLLAHPKTGKIRGLYPHKHIKKFYSQTA